MHPAPFGRRGQRLCTTALRPGAPFASRSSCVVGGKRQQQECARETQQADRAGGADAAGGGAGGAVAERRKACFAQNKRAQAVSGACCVGSQAARPSEVRAASRNSTSERNSVLPSYPHLLVTPTARSTWCGLAHRHPTPLCSLQAGSPRPAGPPPCGGWGWGAGRRGSCDMPALGPPLRGVVVPLVPKGLCLVP